MWYANSSRDQLRRQYLSAWQRHRTGLPLEPLDAQIADVIALHPEYHALLEGTEALTEAGNVDRGNPFLHMGLHLALREQVGTRRPAGIEAVYARLVRRSADTHAAEHCMIDILEESLWEAQRAARAPDEQRYLDRLRRL
jgi:hypothetical protein